MNRGGPEAAAGAGGYVAYEVWQRYDDHGWSHLHKWDYFAFERGKSGHVHPERFVIRKPYIDGGTWLLRDMVSGEERECGSFAECGKAADRLAKITSRRRRSEYRPLTEAYTAYGDRVRIERIEPGSVCYRHLDGKYRGLCGYADSPCELYLRTDDKKG